MLSRTSPPEALTMVSLMPPEGVLKAIVFLAIDLHTQDATAGLRTNGTWDSFSQSISKASTRPTPVPPPTPLTIAV